MSAITIEVRLTESCTQAEKPTAQLSEANHKYKK